MTKTNWNYRTTSPKSQPSKAARRAVHAAFDPGALAHLCTTWDFSTYADKVELTPAADGRERFYWYRDNGSSILAVAHLDSVQADGTCQITQTASGLLATSGALDDRLGVYTILELLPRLGITCDWLLTTDEEIGQSTASDFVPNKDYNWMFQFDRGGTDVVMYDYETPALTELVEASGARVGMGLYSDICMLDYLGCAGLNWGVGYEDYHSPRSHAWLDDTFRMVARFVKFYNANASTFFEYKPFVYEGDGDDYIYDVRADCGHYVQLDDETSYVELSARVLICSTCPQDEWIY